MCTLLSGMPSGAHDMMTALDLSTQFTAPASVLAPPTLWVVEAAAVVERAVEGWVVVAAAVVEGAVEGWVMEAAAVVETAVEGWVVGWLRWWKGRLGARWWRRGVAAERAVKARW